jgi:hypothetical protein
MEGILDQLHQLNASLSTISPFITIAGAAIFGIIAKVILSLRRALDFHDEYFVKKRIKRIKELKDVIKEGPLTRFLDQSLETEAFRISSGITASPAKMNALITIHDSGLWTAPQLRGASRHLVIDDCTLQASITVTKADRVAAMASIMFALILLIAGAGYFLALALTKSLLGFVVGAILFGVFLLVGHLISYDYRAYRVALQVESYLQENTAR